MPIISVIKNKNDLEGFCSVVLAAGKSTRFKSEEPKLLYPIFGKPMITRVASTLEFFGLATTFVLGHRREKIKEVVLQHSTNQENITFAYQEELLGTGHALSCSEQYWSKDNILVLNGDMPLINPQTIKNLCLSHLKGSFNVSFTASTVANPYGYGRVIKNSENSYKIVEQKDAAESERAINLINVGIYLFKKSFLVQNIRKIENQNKSGEFYLPDLINLSSNFKDPVFCLEIDQREALGVNTIEEAELIEKML